MAEPIIVHTTQEPVAATVAAVPAVPQAPPAPATGDAPEGQGADVRMTSDQLKKRLDESREGARIRALKDLGFADMDSAKKKFSELQKLADEKLSADERRDKHIAELTSKAERGERLNALLATVADRRFSELPEQARLAIDAVANGDPEKRLELIHIMDAAGAFRSAPAVPSGAPQPVAPVAPPATTAPAGAPPRPAGTTTLWDRFKELEKRDPMGAGLFYSVNKTAIERERPAAS